jgi:cell shape-determining protein MreC
MRKTYGFIVFCIVALLLLPSVFQKELQQKWLKPFSLFMFSKAKVHDESKEELKLKNNILESQIAYIHEWISSHNTLEELFKELTELGKSKDSYLVNQEFFKRRTQSLSAYIQSFSQFALAKVVYKEPFASSSFIWVNLGSSYNDKVGIPVIQKNSPVVSGDCVIGIVEEVFAASSKVRLLTDPKLVISVRAKRGASQTKMLQQKALQLLDAIELLPDFNFAQKRELSNLLIDLASNLKSEGHDKCLAKGEVFGSEYSMLRSFSPELLGVGFNYQFKDEEGEGLELKRTAPLLRRESIIKKGDLLLTTGMDGLFPKDLKVGQVQEVKSLSIGAFSYQIKAKPIIENINEIEFVQILSPLQDRKMVY